LLPVQRKVVLPGERTILDKFIEPRPLVAIGKARKMIYLEGVCLPNSLQKCLECFPALARPLLWRYPISGRVRHEKNRLQALEAFAEGGLFGGLGAYLVIR